MLTKLNHPHGEVWVNLSEIVHMERENRPNTTLIVANEKEYYTLLTLKNGRNVNVSDTPQEIVEACVEARTLNYVLNSGHSQPASE